MVATCPGTILCRGGAPQMTRTTHHNAIGSSTVIVDTTSHDPLCTLGYVLSRLIPDSRVGNTLDAPDVQHDGITQIDIGSSAEGLYIPPALQRRHKYTSDKTRHPSLAMPDVDFMFVLDVDPFATTDPSVAFAICTHDTTPGYLRLQQRPRTEQSPVKLGCRFTEDCMPEPGKTQYLSFEHVTKAISLMVQTNRKTAQSSDTGSVTDSREDKYEHQLTGPALTINIESCWQGATTAKSYDTAIAFTCPFWPSAAKEWTTRSRRYGTPPRELIDSIVEAGCHFVKVAHSTSTAASTEWRFSFVCAEKKLAKSLTKQQRQCYQIFKLMVKYVLDPHTSVSTYCLKNTLFWTLENLPQEAWHDPVNGLATGFLGLLDRLIMFLSENNLPQYFIPDNNLLLGKPKIGLCDATRRLVQLRCDPIGAALTFDAMYDLDHFVPWPLAECVGSMLGSIGPGSTVDDFLAARFSSQMTHLCEHGKYSWHAVDFSSVLVDIESTHPDFNCFKFCSDTFSGLDIPDFDKSLVLRGFAWFGCSHDLKFTGGHVSAENKECAYVLLRHAIKGHTGQTMSEMSMVCLALIHLKHDETDEAIDHLECVSNKSRTPRYTGQDVHVKDLFLDELSRCILDKNLQIELDLYGRLCYRPRFLAFYLLIQSYLKIDRKHDCKIILSKFQAESFALTTVLGDFLMTATRPFTFGLLGHCFVACNMMEEAIKYFEKQCQYEMNPDLQNAQRIKIINMKKVYLENEPKLGS